MNDRQERALFNIDNLLEAAGILNQALSEENEDRAREAGDDNGREEYLTREMPIPVPEDPAAKAGTDRRGVHDRGTGGGKHL